MQRMKLFCLLVCFMMAVPCMLYAQESLTITTYYPSPFGSYRDLTVSHGMNVGIFSAEPFAEGNVVLSGDNAMVTLWDIALNARPGAPVAGQRYSIRNSGRVLQVNTDGVAGAPLVAVTSAGDIEADGMIYVRQDQGGCFIVQYGTDSGSLPCPSGTSVNTVLSGAAPLDTGGSMVCCRP